MDKRKHYNVVYRNHQYDFTFLYSYSIGSGYRAYIEHMPSYGSRTTTLSATHRLTSGNDYYICWSGRINTEDEMDAVVALWSQATAMYIADGGTSINKYVEAIQAGENVADNDTKTYSVAFGGRTYDFTFHYQNDPSNGYRAYILSMPGYGRRSESLVDTHRLKEDNRYYVCWSEKIWSEDALDAVVALWAKATVMYIVLGGSSIDEHAARLMRS